MGKNTVKQYRKSVSVLYRHPNSKLSDFQSSFEKAIENLNKQKLIYYLCGDFNIDLLQSDTKTVIKNYSDMLFSLGCLPLIKYPTRIAHSSATLIDHFYSNSITQKTTSHILTEDISDHLPIVLLLSNTNHKTIEQNIIVRDTKNFNTENFLIELSENLNIFYNNCTVDEQFERFFDIFNITLSKHAPLRRKSRKEKKLNSKPWITKGILISTKTKNKLYCTLLV